MPDTTIDVEALYAALDSKRKAARTSWRDVARELDISPSTFSRMAQGRRPDVDTFATPRRLLADALSGWSARSAGARLSVGLR